MFSFRTMVAVTCLATAFVPNAVGQSRRAEQAQQSSADLRSLTADLAAQLRLVYRDNLPEFTRRYEQLREAIRAWNASPQSAADRRQMAAWLRNAIRNSMPGAAAPLRSVPTIDQAAIEESSDDDPFRDDPI